MEDEFKQEKAKSPTPAEQNKQLADFYRQSYRYLSPLKFPETSEANDLSSHILNHLSVIGEIKKRENSEVARRLAEKLSILLKPANITQAMKEYLVWDWKKIFLNGIAPLKPPEWVASGSEEPGIYGQDKKLIQSIEQSAYKNVLKAVLAFHKGYGDLFDLLEKFKQVDARLGIKEKNTMPADLDEILKRWRSQYVEKYNNEP